MSDDVAPMLDSTPLPRLPAGYSARASTEADADAIYGLIHDYDVHMVGYSDFAQGDLFEFLHQEHFDVTRDSCLVVDPDGGAAGYTMVWGEEPSRRYEAFAVVHPSHVGRGIGTNLLGFLERRVQEQVVDDEGAVLWNSVDLKDEAACRMVEGAGFAEVRCHSTMLVDLTEMRLEPALPKGITIRTCREDDAELIHSLLEETFAEHWGFTPISYEQWRKQAYDRADTDLSMWFLAVEDDEPVGFLIGRPMEGLGWVADLGVRKGHRKRGIASALLRHSFSDFKKRGFSKAGLGVDASNETGAVRVYENVGMRPERVYITYEKRYKR